MKQNEAIKPKRSSGIIGEALNAPAFILGRLGAKFFGVNRCQLKENAFVFHRGVFTTEIIKFSDIKAWSSIPEMGFDLIYIELVNGDTLNWLDKHDDLASKLRCVAQHKEIPSEADKPTNIANTL